MSYDDVKKICNDFGKDWLKTSIILVILLVFVCLLSYLNGCFGAKGRLAGELDKPSPLGKYSLPSPEDIKNAGYRAAGCFNEYGGDRASYSRLLKWKDTIKDSYFNELVSTEIGRVEKAYPVDILRLHIDGWRFIWKPHVNGAKGFEDPTKFEAQNMIAHLTRDLWKERARAACVLRNIKTAPDKGIVDKKLFYEKLVGLMGEEEKSLCVSKMALETYKDLSGFRSEGTFDFESAIKDWQRRQEEILKIEF